MRKVRGYEVRMGGVSRMTHQFWRNKTNKPNVGGGERCRRERDEAVKVRERGEFNCRGGGVY